MSDFEDASIENIEEAVPEIKPVHEDWLLQNIVQMANDSNSAAVGITLTVGGFLVSGFLAGGKNYFDALGETIKEIFGQFVEDQDLLQKFSESFSGFGQIYSSEGRQGMTPPNYIHLREARFFNTNGAPIPGNRGVWWRGRISEVSGFNFGVLETQK